LWIGLSRREDTLYDTLEQFGGWKQMFDILHSVARVFEEWHFETWANLLTTWVNY